MAKSRNNMGTPIPDPIVGVNCPNWDPPSETPSQIYAMFYDILKGDNPNAVQAPNCHIFNLTQRPGSPCVWQLWNPVAEWLVQVGIAVGETWLWLGDDDISPHWYFVDHKAVSPPSEYELFTNDFQSPFSDWGYGGFGIIFWSDPFIILPGLLGLDQFDDLKLEVFSDVNNDLFFKYCSLKGHVNVVVKIPR